MNKMTKGYLRHKCALYFAIGAIAIMMGVGLPSRMLMTEISKAQNNVLVDATVLRCVKVYEYKDSEGDISRQYDLAVEYNYDGAVYEGIISQSSDWDIGDKFEIYIDPNNPEVNQGINNSVGNVSGMVVMGSIFFLPVGIYLIYKGNTYRIAIVKDARVVATVSKIQTEDCQDSDGRSWSEYCVYVSYEYNGERYKDIYWYGAETKNKTRRRLEKELNQFPKKGEAFQIYVNHKKPSRILSKAPFRIID